MMSEFNKPNLSESLEILNLQDIEKLKAKLQNYKAVCENYLNKLIENADKQYHAQISKSHRLIINHLFTQTLLLRNMVESSAKKFKNYEKSITRKSEQRESVQNLEIQFLKEKGEKMVSDIKLLMNILTKLSNGDNIKESDLIFESEYSEPMKSILQKWIQNKVNSDTQKKNSLSPQLHSDEIIGETASFKGAPSSSTIENISGNDYEGILKPSTANQIKKEGYGTDQPTRRTSGPEEYQSSHFGSISSNQISPKSHFPKNYSSLSLDGLENKICFCDSPPPCNLSYRPCPHSVHSQHNHLSSQSRTNSKHKQESPSTSDSSAEIETVARCPNCQLPL